MFIELKRQHTSAAGTFGVLIADDEKLWASLETPLAPIAGIRYAIPAGAYRCQIVSSPLIERITNGKHRLALEICDVPERSHILFHPGNFQSDSKGCILVGSKAALINGRPAIEKSQAAFADFMQYVEKADDIFLRITEKELIK